SGFSCETAVVCRKIEREGRKNGAAQTTDVDGTARGTVRAGGPVGPGRRHFLCDGGGNDWTEIPAHHLSAGCFGAGARSSGAIERSGNRKRRIHKSCGAHTRQSAAEKQEH